MTADGALAVLRARLQPGDAGHNQAIADVTLELARLRGLVRDMSLEIERLRDGAPEIVCPNCEATIRARMADYPAGDR